MKWIIFLLITSCGQFLSSTQSDFSEKITINSGHTHGAIIFSGNINGEIEPCGCRQFPLGGIAQVKGLIEKAKSEFPLIYVDTGDTFFPSPVVPKNMHRSLGTTAQALSDGMELMPLKIFSPGDQDFALGLNYLEDMSTRVHYTFLMSNLIKGSTKIKSEPWLIFKMGERKIIFLGVIDPELLPAHLSVHFESADKSIERTLKELAPHLVSSDLVILLSHSGMDEDKMLAKKFPRINWILGSHSQSYTAQPIEEGETKLVQVLSRNHYLGQILFPLSGKKIGEFKLLESREETIHLVKPNPLVPFVENYRKELKAVQSLEQKEMMSEHKPNQSLATYHQCMECHQKQTEFWQQTAHSISYATLYNKDAQHNPNCIKCHSLGFQEEDGFASTHSNFSTSKKLTSAQIQKYWDNFSRVFNKKQSIRSLTPQERFKLSDAWIKLDKKNNVTHQFSNVQCLHCHEIKPDHPVKHAPSEMMFEKCLKCHTQDQNPEWYQSEKIKMELIQEKIKQVACPRNLNE